MCATVLGTALISLGSLFSREAAPLLGIDVSSSTVKLVEIGRERDGSLVLEHCAIEPLERGWVTEKSKVFTRVNPLVFAVEWAGKHRRRLTSDLDQALVLVGACFEGSGINAADTLRNPNFKPHVALKALLDWLQRNGPDIVSRNAATRALAIHQQWQATQTQAPRQTSLFDDEEDYR